MHTDWLPSVCWLQAERDSLKDKLQEAKAGWKQCYQAAQKDQELFEH